MSLTSRVRAADGAGARSGFGGALGLDELKDGMQSFVSVDDLAVMMRDNPSRARNEIRSACRQVFEGEAWADVGRSLRGSWWTRCSGSAL